MRPNGSGTQLLSHNEHLLNLGFSGVAGSPVDPDIDETQPEGIETHGDKFAAIQLEVPAVPGDEGAGGAGGGGWGCRGR